MRILVVDDEKFIRAFLSEFLESQGYDVECAESGVKALTAIQSQKPDLVITDINMPGLTGIQLLKKIHSDDPDMPVIVLTGQGDFDSALEAIHHGAYDYMLKPPQRALLLKRIEHIENVAKFEKEKEDNRNKAMHAARMAAIGNLSAGAAHEINNPLTFIRGNTQILKKLIGKCFGPEGEEADEGSACESLTKKCEPLFESINAGCTRIQKIVEQLMMLANYESDESRSPVPASELIDDALMLATKQSEWVKVSVEILEPEPVLFIAKKKFSRAILCLMSNAIKAIESGQEGQIKVTASIGEKGWSIITIEDSGCGISPALREKVFEPFFTTRDVNEGAGLGMCVVYGAVCVDLHGKIEIADSGLGGAKIIISLPPE